MRSPATRAGALGVLNLEFATEHAPSLAALRQLESYAHGHYGVLLDSADAELLTAVLDQDLPGLETIILTAGAPGSLASAADAVKQAGLNAYLVVTSLDEALVGVEAGFDALIAKGSESGGWVGEETAFVLTQHLVSEVDLPIYVQGGIGLHSASAAIVAGAVGVVLDDQLLLTRESSPSGTARTWLEAMDGSETQVIGSTFGAAFRCYSRPGLPLLEEMTQLEVSRELAALPREAARAAWRSAVREKAGSLAGGLFGLGQDAAFAASLARRYITVGGVIGAIEKSTTQHLQQAREQLALSEATAWAKSHSTRYPIVQGPMTRVSDKAGFADAVAAAGGLPFLALALMRAPEIETLLAETSDLLAGRSWGVGILGFVPPDLREEQLNVIREFKPPFALIAGGRPDQAKSLESEGIATYLHVPSPGLLKLFLSDGARRFVFEGRECGGHVGPRTSFVLWESMIEVLLQFLTGGADANIDVLFAGGVHDGLSAAMVATMAAPLVEKGVRIGVLAGTAYLFTDEAVSTGAIEERFQTAAVECAQTVTLQATPGYATRCLPSPFVSIFEDEKRRLLRDGVTGDDLKNELEFLNIGRLRIASKGVDRNPAYSEGSSTPRMIEVVPDDQWQQGLYMIGQVAALHRGVSSIADLHEEIAAGSARRIRGVAEVVSQEHAPPPTAVAIVGMASILPGASDLDQFWANIINKKDAVDEVPESRWDANAYYDPDRSARDKIYSRWGGFIDEVPFDPIEFGMPPNTLTSIEAFQLLALLVVRDAIKDAGYAERPFERETTSVMLGAGGIADLSQGYIVRSTLPALFGDRATDLTDMLTGVLPEWTEDSFPGFLQNVAAGRIANRFNFGGVNYTVDAACASSLAAIYLGVRDLENKTSDVVIAGGVDSIQTPFGFLSFSKTQALSPTGRSRPFDAEADGIAISEGFGALVLKRLEDAERDGDRIYAVIRGVGGSSDGRDRSLTAPRPEGQVLAYRRAYANAGFSPATVGLIEAHGTGTVAGDQSELSSLRQVFEGVGAAIQTTAIGSVKSMVGHTKAAAGAVGMIKVAKALYHRVLPPTLGVSKPNPRFDFQHSPFYVNTEPRPWVHSTDAPPRRAGVSAFGFGGTNFHVALEEYQGAFLPALEPGLDTWPAELFIWRAEGRSVLLKEVQALLDQLGLGAEPRLADLAYTLAPRFQSATGDARLAMVAESLPELRDRLQSAAAILEGGGGRSHLPTGVHFSETPLAADGSTAFVFPGQGSQYVNMGRDLAIVFPEVREELDSADQALDGRLERPLSSYIFPPPSFGPEEEKWRQDELTDTSVTQPALGATELAMLRLLDRLAIRPDLTAGHSYGEFVALYAAGVLSKEAMLSLSATRGRLMKEDGGVGTMAAVLAPSEALTDLAVELDLTLANVNSPTQTVVSGTIPAIESAIQRCTERGLTARRLPVGSAFHSPLVARVKEKFAAALEAVELQPAQIPAYSNTTGEEYPSDLSQMRSLLAEHLARPVNFVREIEAMYANGARVFVEVGPRQVLTGLIDQILGDREHVSVALDNPSRPGLWPLLNGLGALAAEGVDFDVSQLFRGRKVRRLDLSRLREDCQPHYSATTWMVSGGGARPLGRELPRASLPVSLDLPSSRAHAPTTGDTPGVPAPMPTTPATPVAREALRTSAGNAAAPIPAASGAAGVLQHFQSVMDHFLQVQEANMTAIFRRAGEPPSVPPKPTKSPLATSNAHAAATKPSTVGRYLPRLVPAPPLGPASGLDPDGVVAVAGGDAAFASALSQQLEEVGYRTVRIVLDASSNGSSATLKLLSGATRETADRLVSQIHDAYGRLSGLFYLGLPDVSGHKSGLAKGCPELFLLLQALHADLMQSAESGGAAVIGVTAMGGSFGFEGPLSESSGCGWLPGLLKSLAKEWPEVRVKTIDLPAADARFAEHLLAEAMSDGSTEVGYSAALARYMLELAPAPLGSASAPLQLTKDSVVLATGGARGITAEACIALAEHGPATFVLVGRTEAPSRPEDVRTAGLTDEKAIKGALLDQLTEQGATPAPLKIEQAYVRLMREREIRSTVARLGSTGARVDYRACDVQDAQAFERLLDAVYGQYSRIDAVIHGAGVIEDRLLESKSLDSFQRVLGTKLSAAEVLANRLQLRLASASRVLQLDYGPGRQPRPDRLQRRQRGPEQASAVARPALAGPRRLDQLGAVVGGRHGFSGSPAPVRAERH